MEQTILAMEKICKSFGNIPVLKEVDFHLRKGEIHALVGGNGAGKSTLMKIMTGVYQLDKGKIYYDGKETPIQKPSDAKKIGIEMIFQELSLIQSMTVSENIFLGEELIRNGLRDTKAMAEKSKQVLNQLGIAVDPATTVSQLSVGMSQMVEIAKAVSKDAKILIFDEPTASLSGQETERLFSLMAQLKAQGVSMVYISHRMNEILQIADRITILKDGAHVVTDEIQRMSLEKIIAHMVGGEGGNKFKWLPRTYDEQGDDLLTVKNLAVNEKIKDISFSLKRKEILGLAGLMGSGRTEILETLFGLREKRNGSVLLEGNEISCRNASDAIRAGFALIPEDRRKQGLILTHSVKENAVLPMATQLVKNLFISDEKKCNEMVHNNIRQLGIVTSSMHKTIHLLSGGNQQKVVIAKWLNRNPKIMMLDEPTAGVDIGAKGEIIQIIRQYADQGNGVIFVSSEISELMAVCDRIIIIYDGHITGEMARKDIKTEEALQNAIQKSQ